MAGIPIAVGRQATVARLTCLNDEEARNLNFKYTKNLSDDVFTRLTELKAFSPEVLMQEAERRERAGFPHKKLVFAAADHNARMITEYQGNPIGLSDRKEYLARLIRILESPEVDGVEGSPDVLEDLMLLNYLAREDGQREFLRGKMLVGTVNRGGLKGSVWEMDDMPVCFTVEHLAALRMDGIKFMIRINPADAGSRKTIEYCAETVNAALKYGLPIFIEALYVDSKDGHSVMKTDLVSLCRAVGVVSALGTISVNKWIEVPLNGEYLVPVGATTCPVLVVPDEREEEPLKVVREYTEQAKLSDQIRGILLGRNVMYNESDPQILAEAIADVWHTDISPEEAYRKACKETVNSGS